MVDAPSPPLATITAKVERGADKKKISVNARRTSSRDMLPPIVCATSEIVSNPLETNGMAHMHAEGATRGAGKFGGYAKAEAADLQAAARDCLSSLCIQPSPIRPSPSITIDDGSGTA